MAFPPSSKGLGLMEQTRDLLGVDFQDAERQMGVHLGSPTQLYMPSAVVALQQTVTPSNWLSAW